MLRFWLALALVFGGFALWRALGAGRRRPRRPEQALILTLRLADDETSPAALHERLREVDAALRAAIDARGVGEIEEPFRRGVECVYTCYGPDADRLWDAVRIGLEGAPLLAGSRAILRYGGPGAHEEALALGARSGPPPAA